MNISTFVNTSYIPSGSPVIGFENTAAVAPIPSFQMQGNEDKRFDRLVKSPFEGGQGHKTADGKTVSDINEDQSCKTCASRTYQDGSDDPSVSFKSPTSVPVGSEASAVMGHEREHVANETANAKSNGRKIVSQAIRIYTAVCSECKRVYVSGGTTTTVTADDSQKKQKNATKLDFAV